MKKVLVMGGSYFIGKHVVNTLKETYDVTILNRGSKPFNDALVKEIVCDRNDEALLKKSLSPYAFNYIIDISGFTKIQSKTFVESLNLINLEKFIYISTSAAYNIQALTPPFKETDTLGGESPFKDYAKNKIEAEDYLIETLPKEKLVILRPPIVYGEDNYILRERLIFHLIEQDLPIYIPVSNNKISFVYVKDLAHDIRRFIENEISPGIYNVGNKEPLSFLDWVNLCASVINKAPNIRFIDNNHPDYDVRYYFPFFDYNNILSVDKLKKQAPFETPIIEGLQAAYKDYQTIKHTIKMPDKMLNMRNLIANENH